MRIAIVFASLPLALAFSSVALAADPAAAQALFERGKQLADQRRLDDACRAFAESQRLDPGIGTLFHLADCEEQRGRTATAWATFLEVASEARAKGEEPRARAARDRAQAMEPRLARMTIDPGADRGLAGLTITRDDVVLGEGAWAVATPVDPGPHTIVVTAPGHGAWNTRVDVAPGARSLVTVPLLATVADAPSSEPTSRATTTSAEIDRGDTVNERGRGNTQRTIGLALGVAGLAGVGVGTYFGLVSKSKHDAAAGHCDGDVCDGSGLALRDDARGAGNASTVAFVAGGALVATGLLTFFAAPHDSGGGAAASPSARLALSPAGVTLSGRW